MANTPDTLPADSTRTKNTLAEKIYAPISIHINNVDTSGTTIAVTFTAISKTGNPYQFNNIVWDASNSDIWLQYPSSGVSPPVSGANGILYVKQAILTQGNLPGTPKWPDSLGPEVPFKKLSVWPTHVIVKGFELRDGELTPGTVDLLNPLHARTIQNSDPATKHKQNITLDGGAITLWLTSDGFGECFGVSFPPGALQRAVDTIKAGSDACSMADAWAMIAAWVDMSRASPSLVTAEARSLVGQVVNQLEV